MTGDSVSGYAWDGATNWFAPLWQHLISPMNNAGIPWAFALGNHDDPADLSRDEIVALDLANPLSYTQRGPTSISGATNYVLPIYAYQPNHSDQVDVGEVPIANLYFFDSGDDDCQGVPGWGCVQPDQVDWYRSISRNQTQSYGRIVPALAFQHIPVPEFMFLWNHFNTTGLLQDDGVCCFSVNTGLYSAMREMGDIQSLHVGHDHNNDYFGDYYGITLAYGRKSGYGGYGPPDGWLRGTRLLQLQANPYDVKTWIRQQDGSVVSQQPLHPPSPTDQWNVCCGAVGGPPSACSAYERNFRAATSTRARYY